MMLAIFRIFLVLLICSPVICFSQTSNSQSFIELGSLSFPIERSFAISVTIANSDNRPVLTFPDIPGFTKKGISTRVTATDNGEKNGVIGQVITQSYQARLAGRFVLAPFSMTVDGGVLSSQGAVLVVLPSATATTNVPAPPLPGGEAFLRVRVSKPVLYRGEGVGLSLSLFVADSYPYELTLTALDRQLGAIIKTIRPANAWEENRPITELKPLPVMIGQRKFRQIMLYQSVFYPISTQRLTLPAVTLRLLRPRPKIGPPSAEAQTVLFTSKPVTVIVRALPLHPLREQVAVGAFRLTEQLDRQRVRVGESVRYGFTITGEGNVAMLPTATVPAKTIPADVFPPDEHHTIRHEGDWVTGQKTFTYFIIPRQTGTISLADRFQWIYFDPLRARYDTLRPHLQVQAGDANALATAETFAPSGTSAASGDAALASGQSLYAGISALDSQHQPLSIPVLIRAGANVLIVLMLLGMIFVFFKK